MSVKDYLFVRGSFTGARLTYSFLVAKVDTEIA